MTDKHTNLDFSEALFLLKQGYRVARESWVDGKPSYLALMEGEEKIGACYEENQPLQPFWVVRVELFANDWYVVLNEAA